ncbi:MAG: uncharacterized protein QG656_399, partial [Candidatus Hydrogenedentes bacterium]|nr:uncharacterized protein [Candidatus Hydrogenedentota bacterium]
VDSLSCGVSVPGDFDLHVDAAEQLDRAAELTAPIVERLDAELALVLGADWMATWRDGLPEWRDTPGGINIPVILRLRNLALAFGMIEYGKMRYNLIGNAGNWFPGQNCAKLAEVDLTECLKRSPNAARIPAALREIHELLAGESVKRLQKDE